MLLTLAGAFSLTLVAVHRIESHGMHEIVAQQSSSYANLFDEVLMRAELPLRMFTDSYARRASLTRPNETPRGASAAATLVSGLNTFELHFAWVIEADGTVRLTASASGAGSATSALPPPLSSSELKSIEGTKVNFYTESRGAIYHVRGARLSADSTNPDTIRGWLFAATRWEVGAVAMPSLPRGSRVTVLTPGEAGTAANEEYPVRVERMLTDFSNRPIRLLRFEYRPAEIEIAESSELLELVVIGVFGLVSLAVLGICLFRWLVVPAGAIHRSLKHRNSEALRPLLERKDILSDVAELVRRSIDTQMQLEKSIEERAQLGRELHDGVIQTVFAAGMGLASVRATLRDQPATAEAVIDQTRAELNAVILELRAFIRGLEPERAEQRKFSDAVRTICGLMGSTNSLQFTVEIDDQRADALPVASRMQLLQIIREATSNVVRHSGATAVTVRLWRENQGTALEVCDNGKGIDPAAQGRGGRGLANFQLRVAELGGTLTVAPRVGGGTCVRIVLTEK